MTRLRYYLFVLFGGLAIFPLAVFWFWSQSQLLEAEFEEVHDRHLLLARNLGAALERYHSDVSAAFNMVAASLSARGAALEVDDLLQKLGFLHICLIDQVEGKVVAMARLKSARALGPIPASHMDRLKALATADGLRFSEVMESSDGAPVMYVVGTVGNKLALGALTTDYFVRLGKAIAFGVKGHAAIVDHQGNVLAHPLDSWIAQRKNIAKVSAVQRMMRGETGIQQFYSPALKGDMIAGFTSVPGPGWGVMIPQPVEELYAHAARSRGSALIVIGVCLLVVAYLSITISVYLARPLERIVAAIDGARTTQDMEEVQLIRPRLLPAELRKVQKSFNRMVRRLKDNLVHIRRLAYSDPITGLPNRETFRILTNHEIDRLRQFDAPGAMLFIDLDDFKAVNDTLGHFSGDSVLRTLSARLVRVLHEATGREPVMWPLKDGSLQPSVSGGPILARIGGDEFAVFLPGIDNDDRLGSILDQIGARLGDGVDVGGGEIVTGASIGAALFPEDGNSFDAILKRADIAMHHAKRSGKNKAQIFASEIGDLTIAELRRDVGRAIENGEMTLHYQPKLTCASNGIDSVEALIRWNHPERGLLSPAAFIPMVEESDVIIALGEWVIRAAAADITSWRERGLDLAVSVNISARHFCSRGFVDRIKRIIGETGLDPSYFELEITEEVVMSNLSANGKAIRALQDVGIRVALDDFGRGYSNLTRLAELPIDTLKIDGYLTASVASSERTRVIIKTTIEMAEGLGCETVAEGIETPAQAAFLTKLGCTHLQGFQLARPMKSEDLQDWVASYGTSRVRDMQDGLEDSLAQSS